MSETTALQKQMVSDAPNQAIQQYPVLDRENLTFFANLIESAGLIPVEKDDNKKLLPIQLRKFRVMAKIVGGTAYGFDPISAQVNLDIINGRLVLNARGMSVLVGRSGLYSTRVVKLDNDGCKLQVLHRDTLQSEWRVKGYVEFNKEMAKNAGLIDKPGSMYKKWGPDMYFARCITRVAKRFAPECLDTIPTTYQLAAKTGPESAPEPAQLPETSETEIGETFEDPIAETVASEEVEGEFVEAEESEREVAQESIDAVDDDPAPVIADIERMIGELVESGEDRKALMKGRVFENMTVKQLDEMKSEMVDLCAEKLG